MKVTVFVTDYVFSEGTEVQELACGTFRLEDW